MKRPYISISGTLDELILMEAILAHYYTVPDEECNNEACDESDPFKMNELGSWLICRPEPINNVSYFNHKGFRAKKENSFKASQLEEILTYIEEYEKN